MQVHVFQHVPFEGLGAISSWLERRRADITYTRFFEDPNSVPREWHHDLLVVMGGPMSVNDEVRYPWLEHEKRAVAAAVATGMPVLGVCLGAQMLASALGARVLPNPEKEIGWWTVEGTGARALFERGRSHRVFQWHGETFELPPSAQLLASSAACNHQAFLLAPRVLGLQFHLETTREGVRALVDHCGDELVSGPYIQSAHELLAAPASHFTELHRLLERVLEALVQH